MGPGHCMPLSEISLVNCDSRAMPFCFRMSPAYSGVWSSANITARNAATMSRGQDMRQIMDSEGSEAYLYA